jgi:hypothetical protein
MDLHLNILPYLASAVGAAIVAGGFIGWLDLRFAGRSRESASNAGTASDRAPHEMNTEPEAA